VAPDLSSRAAKAASWASPSELTQQQQTVPLVEQIIIKSNASRRVDLLKQTSNSNGLLLFNGMSTRKCHSGQICGGEETRDEI